MTSCLEPRRARFKTRVPVLLPMLGLLVVLVSAPIQSEAEAQAPASPAEAQAQIVTPIPTPLRALTLREAKQIAFERNWDLLAARSNVDLATAQKIIAHEFPNPTFSWTTSKINLDRGSGTEFGNSLWDRSYDTIASINQLFEIGGKRSSRQASARAGFEGAKARLEDARRTLDLGVTQAYIAVLLAETNVHILRQSAESLRKEAAIAETRFRAGDISLADQSQIEIEADRLGLDADAAAATATTARISLEVLLGENHPQGAWVPVDTLESLAGMPAVKLSEAAAETRPDLRAAEADVRKAEADLRLQKAMRIPDPTVMLMYEHEPPDTPNTIGLGVAFPLPLWNRNRGNIQAATATRNTAAIQAQKVRAGIAGEVNTASVNYADASARLRRQQQMIQPKSAQIREAVSFAFSRGGASLVDLLIAERNDNEVRLSTAQAMADSAKAAAALKAALNVSEGPSNRSVVK